MSDLVKDGNCFTIKVGSAINAKNSNDLKVKLQQFFDDGAKRIVIDMAKTEIIDSIGLGLLSATHNSLRARNGKLELINVKENIFNVINLMRLDKCFIINGFDGTS